MLKTYVVPIAGSDQELIAQAEQEVKEEEERLRFAQRSLDSAIWETAKKLKPSEVLHISLSVESQRGTYAYRMTTDGKYMIFENPPTVPVP